MMHDRLIQRHAAFRAEPVFGSDDIGMHRAGVTRRQFVCGFQNLRVGRFLERLEFLLDLLHQSGRAIGFSFVRSDVEGGYAAHEMDPLHL